MKKFIISAVLFVLFWAVSAHAFLVGKEAHERYLYPTVRIETGKATGSGTVVYSRQGADECYSTYILTNYHVVSGAISIEEQWDTHLQKNVKKEKRSLVYVEIFKYKNLSTPVGTTRLEADIVIYTEDEDMAILKLRYDGLIDNVATLPLEEHVDDYRVMDESVAVGCSLGWPPLISTGVITRKSYQIDSLPFDMSSAQIIFGNSGGGMYDAAGYLVGIPSKVALQGWSVAVTHMGLFIPAHRIYKWLEKEHYDFIYMPAKDEATCLKEREEEIKKKVERGEG